MLNSWRALTVAFVFFMLAAFLSSAAANSNKRFQSDLHLGQDVKKPEVRVAEDRQNRIQRQRRLTLLHPNKLADGLDRKRSADAVDASVLKRADDDADDYVEPAADEVIKRAADEVIKRAADDVVNRAADDYVEHAADEVIKRAADDAASEASDASQSVNDEIEKARAVLSASIQNRQRSVGNAIQGSVELAKAKQGKFEDLADEALVYSKSSHLQHWYVPGNKTTATDNLATSGNST